MYPGLDDKRIEKMTFAEKEPRRKSDEWANPNISHQHLDHKESQFQNLIRSALKSDRQHQDSSKSFVMKNSIIQKLNAFLRKGESIVLFRKRCLVHNPLEGIALWLSLGDSPLFP